MSALAGRTALITGASQGLGAEIAAQFLDAGAAVMLCARGADDLERRRAALATRYPAARVLARAADVANRAQIDALFDDAIAQLRALAGDTKLDISAAIDQFESRVGFMVATGIETGSTRFSTSFGRGLDYYTGFEFELHARGDGVEPLVAGGRYDGLMTQLGAPAPIPAVGFSIWVETLTQLGRKPAAAASSGSAS